jgi:putative FmdB family regulatory protein
LPLYDYQCSACNHRFELRQGFDSDSVADCPSCGASAKRRFNSVAVIYKGSGFYTTDYARKHLSEPTPSSNGTPVENPVVPPKPKEEPTAAPKASDEGVKSGEG